jgi:peptidoglycan/LPS O-acetylase OafA/YrhL
MIGRIRFVLASLVVLNHVYLPTANLMGAHAVAAFYIISGFLMTQIIHEVYGTSVSGCGRFLLNRFLRIYPPYWIFLTLTLLGLVIFPATFGQTYPNMQLPPTAYGYFRNITLYGLPWSEVIVIPPAWTLTVEVFFYLAMPLLLARSRGIAVVWLAVSIVITIWLLVTEPRFGPRYTPPYAASVFFATGSMIFFFRERARALALPVRWAWTLFALFAALPIIVEWAGGQRGYIGFYVAALIFVPVLVTALDQTALPGDRWFGDLAYPVFITHLLAAAIVRTVFPSRTPMTLLFFLLTYAASIVISAAFVTWQRRTLEPVRARVRAQAA